MSQAHRDNLATLQVPSLRAELRHHLSMYFDCDYEPHRQEHYQAILEVRAELGLQLGLEADIACKQELAAVNAERRQRVEANRAAIDALPKPRRSTEVT